ncbi:hypothetical protein M8Q32_13415 [Enterobacter hormaechei]|nr:hypothetical protein [Enterobacter hormaechei]MCM7247614.1 hypothetical protein [Enterobacter hormaechei]
MSNIDKQAVQAVADLKAGYTLGQADVAILNELARIALASLEVEPVAYMYKDNLHADARFSLHTRFGNWSQEDINEYEITEIPLYTAPPAPVSVPEEMTPKQASRAYCGEVRGYRDGWNACRAAMLQGAVGNSPVIQDGWRLVPEEPTHEMLEAGDEQFGTYDVYRRMIAASPQQK